MKTISIHLQERSYDIHIAPGLSASFGDLLKKIAREPKALIVTDDNLLGLYAVKLARALQSAGFDIDVLSIPPGEENKSLDNATVIWNKLIDRRMGRKSLLIALGGGVIGDVTGFAAAAFMRGIDFVQIPTSMIGQLDSSIGGKTGVNFPQAKNIVGAFHQPRAVLTDTDFLKTLPKRELASGMAEAVKYAMIFSEDFFAFMESNVEKLKELDPSAMDQLMTACIGWKAALIQKDEKEISGERAVLNLGHTVGHALEKIGGYGKYRHGEAVAIGLVECLKLGLELGVTTDKKILPRLVHLLRTFNLPVAFSDMDPKTIVDTIQMDKKGNSGNQIRFILPVENGRVLQQFIEPEILLKTLSNQSPAFS